MVDKVFYPKYSSLGLVGNNRMSMPFSGTAQSDDVSLFSASNKYSANSPISEYGQKKENADIPTTEPVNIFAQNKYSQPQPKWGILERPSRPINIFARSKTKFGNSAPKAQKTEDDDLVTSCALKTFSPYRRFASIPSELSQGQVATALSMAAYAAINLPEDMRDVKNGFAQIKAFFKGEKYKGKYDYKTVQHPFSFFRGTLLQRFVDPNTSKNPKLTLRILKSDTTMAKTNLGTKIINFFGAQKCDQIETEIKAIGHTKENPIFISANVYKGTKFGILTAHALERTTKWGLAVTALLEVPQIIKEFCHGDNILKKGENGTKQVFKSAMNVALTTAGIGYMGAIGNKFGPLFSLAGMATGAVLGGYGSRKIQDLVS